MTFASAAFLFRFLPLCLVAYYLTPAIRLKNLVLIAASLIFYAWGEPVWVALLLFSTAVDYTCSRLMTGREGRRRRACLALSVVVNLGLLAFFKYSAFFVGNLNSLLGVSLRAPQFALPIGISFYTFQTMSATLDVYYKRVNAPRSPLDFLCFVSLFPQLVAGPVVRYSDIAHELRDRTPDIPGGTRRFVVGLGKKVLLANTVGALADVYLKHPETVTVFGAWTGAACFAFQLYFDFSGYSDMAIGLGLLFGFHFKENFNYPYAGRSVTDFWRRWHMSLTTFFRDYLYIPLGGNRAGTPKTVRNLLIVWLLTGLWHGASWNFVLWGLYLFLVLALERFFLRKILDRIPALFGRIYMLLAMLVGWTLFYFTETRAAFLTLGVMFGAGGRALARFSDFPRIASHALFFAAAVIGLFPWAKKIPNTRTVSLLRALALAALFALSVAAMVTETFNPFIYFRF
ncbi:MAG: MBOAT family protein [Oscillospiraceae bacterium]|nr:MBOAT family protein [Oscillospiraceae bacterium]